MDTAGHNIVSWDSCPQQHMSFIVTLKTKKKILIRLKGKMWKGGRNAYLNNFTATLHNTAVNQEHSGNVTFNFDYINSQRHIALCNSIICMLSASLQVRH